MRVLTDTAQATVLLCTRLALRNDRVKPYTPLQWYELGLRIIQSNIHEPGNLFGLSAEEIAKQLSCSPAEAGRIAALLDRGVDYGFELERLGQQGIDIVTKSDPDYPKRLVRVLGPRMAPPVLFSCGDTALADTEGIAVAGSRNVNADGLDMAVRLGSAAADQELTVFSGGAKGVDKASAHGVLANQGKSVAFLTGDLSRTIRQKAVRDFIVDGRLLLLSARLPSDYFTGWAAMERNKYVYALSRAGFVITSGISHVTVRKESGTWEGAVQTLKNGWVPVFVWKDTEAPGNKALLKEGAIPFSAGDILDLRKLITKAGAPDQEKGLENPTLFDFGMESPAAGPDQSPKETDKPQTIALSASLAPEKEPKGEKIGEAVFNAAWGQLSPLFKEPSTSKEVLEQLDGMVLKGQLDKWILMALDHHFLVKKRNPVRYVLADKSE